PDKIRLDTTRPADAGERGSQRLEGRPNVDKAKGVSWQFLLALPRHCRLPVAGIAKLARAYDRSGHSGNRRESRTRPSEASYEASIYRETQLGPSHKVLGRRR